MSRPKMNPKFHRKEINLTMSPKTIDVAKAMAKRRGKSVSAMIEAFILVMNNQAEEREL